MPKRKTDNDNNEGGTGSKDVLSKQERRKLAIMRAKMSMEADKKRVEATLKQKSGAAASASSASSTSSQKKKKTETPKKNDTHRSREPDSEEDSDENENNKPSFVSPTKRRKLSYKETASMKKRREDRELAIQRAKEWAKIDKENLEKQKSPLSRKKATKTASSSSYPQPTTSSTTTNTAVARPPPTAPPPTAPAPCTATPHFSNINTTPSSQQPMMHPAAMYPPYGGSQPNMYRMPTPQQQQQNFPAYGGNSYNAMNGQPPPYAYASSPAYQVPPFDSKKPAVDESIPDVHSEGTRGKSDKDTPPPPPQHTQHPQVFYFGASPRHESSSQHSQQEQAPPQHTEPSQVVEQEDDYEEPAPIKRYTIKTSLVAAILVGLVGFLLALDVNFESIDKAPVKHVNLGDAPPCFLDSDKVAVDSATLSPCPDGGEPCPDDAECSNGILTSCINRHYEVSPNGMECILSEESLQTIALWTDVLQTRSIEFQCAPPFSTVMPTFRYSDLIIEHNDELAGNPLEVGILQTDFVTEHHDNGFYIGLPEDFKLRYPLGCRVSMKFKYLMSWLGSSIAAISYIALSIAWSWFRTYPLASIVAVIVLSLIKRGRDYRAHRKQLLMDIATSREMAYDLLQENPEHMHAVLHIRDDIANTLFPDSRKRRKYLITEVWPRVMTHLLEDNRVRKCTKVMDGKPRDMWQWVAAVPSSGGQKRKRNVTIGDQ